MNSALPRMVQPVSSEARLSLMRGVQPTAAATPLAKGKGAISQRCVPMVGSAATLLRGVAYRKRGGVRPYGSETKLIYWAGHLSWADGAKGKRCADSPPPCGEGLGVGGTPTLDVLQSPPPCPSPTRGEGTLRLALRYGKGGP